MPYEVSTTDVSTFAGAAAFVGLVAVLATWIPARLRVTGGASHGITRRVRREAWLDADAHEDDVSSQLACHTDSRECRLQVVIARRGCHSAAVHFRRQDIHETCPLLTSSS
jgi:hypothetical protein